MRTCPRCGQPYELHRLTQTRCLPCHRDVDRLIQADDKRREPRLPARDDTGLIYVRVAA